MLEFGATDEYSRLSVQEAQPLLVRQALACWIEHGILQFKNKQLEFAAQPIPVVIPGGGTYHSHIEKAAVAAMHNESWRGETYVISTPDEAADAVADILHSCNAAAAAAAGLAPADRAPSFPKPREQLQTGLSAVQAATILGFDLEFKAVYKAGSPVPPPALIQVATPWAVYLFHLRTFTSAAKFQNDRAAVEQALMVLQPLLEAEHIYKCGVGVDGDVTLMRKFARNIQYRGFVDTERVALAAKFKRHSLQALSCLLLGHSISKQQQCSNWAAAQLKPAQVRYAATDAWVSREVSLALAPLWYPRGGGAVDSQWLVATRPEEAGDAEDVRREAGKQPRVRETVAAGAAPA